MKAASPVRYVRSEDGRHIASFRQERTIEFQPVGRLGELVIEDEQLDIFPAQDLAAPTC